MIALTLEEIARLAPGELVGGRAGDVVTGVTIDSRRVGPGDLFVAVRGGVAFLDDARARGGATLVPDDALAALAALAGAVRERSRATAVGITGSMGKTSTKDVLAALCAPHRRTVATEASYNAELGVPLTLCRLEPDTELCIAELAMRGFGQIRTLGELLRPDVGVITNVAPVHLEHVGSVAGVARAKAELLELLPRGAAAVVPADAPELEPYLRPDLELVRVGVDARLLRFDPPRLEAEIGGRRVTVEVPFAARHQAENAVTALAAYAALGLPLEEAWRGAASIAFSRLRGDELPLPGGGVLVNDCWNANPVSMEAALEHLARIADGRRTVAVLGEMAELGAEAPRYHDRIGEAVARTRVDVLVTVGPLARRYAASGVPEWHAVETAPEAVGVLRDVLRDRDAVLVKGSRALGLERVAAGLELVSA